MLETTPLTLSATSIIGDQVVNRAGEDLGEIHEIMIDINRGRVAYAVLSFGGLLGIGDKLFAIPWDMIAIDKANKRVVLEVTQEQLDKADGFAKDAWPDFAEESFHTSTYGYWRHTPYWAD